MLTMWKIEGKDIRRSGWAKKELELWTKANRDTHLFTSLKAEIFLRTAVKTLVLDLTETKLSEETAHTEPHLAPDSDAATR